MSTIRALPLVLALLAACGGQGGEPAPAAPRDTTPEVSGAAGGAAGGTMLASSAAMLGRWEKIERSLPPITVELRADAADRITGRVAFSGVTYDGVAALDDTSFVVSAAGRPTLRATVTGANRARVRLSDSTGATVHEATLAKIE